MLRSSVGALATVAFLIPLAVSFDLSADMIPPVLLAVYLISLLVPPAVTRWRGRCHET
jgi:hypothetical protein